MPADFGSGMCNIDEIFRQHRIVQDVTFCGDWAASVWEETDWCVFVSGSLRVWLLTW